MHKKIATEFTGQWSSGRNRVKCGPIRRTARPVRDYANGSGQWARVARCVTALTDARRAITSGENAVTKKQSSLRRSLLAATAVAFGLPLIAAQATPAAAADETAIHPFHYRASESALADLRKRIANTRWPIRRPSRIARKEISSRGSRRSSITGAPTTIGARWSRD